MRRAFDDDDGVDEESARCAREDARCYVALLLATATYYA